MLTLALTLAAALIGQPANPQAPERPVLKAGLGSCSADFTVTGVDGQPAYLAVIHVKMRYGAMGIKRMDLEVSTDARGQARIEGLPAKARPLVFDITLAGTKGGAGQDLAKSCQAQHVVSLK